MSGYSIRPFYMSKGLIDRKSLYIMTKTNFFAGILQLANYLCSNSVSQIFFEEVLQIANHLRNNFRIANHLCSNSKIANHCI